MKPLLAFVGGFGLSLAIFCTGIVTAIFFLHADPVQVRKPGQGVAGLWTLEPRRVARDAPAQETVAAAPVGDGQDVVPVRSASVEDGAGIDNMETSALSSGGDPDPREMEWQAMEIAHLEWCASRFRSYRPVDDSYTTYGGERRRCVSPYSDAPSRNGEELVEAGADVSGDVLSVQYADGGASFGQDHIDYCFSRYRSYRVADNSYQPYGGGPRRQCE